MTPIEALKKIEKIIKETLGPEVLFIQDTKFNQDEKFEELWKTYPASRRDCKPKCKEIFKKTVKSEEDYIKIKKALHYYINIIPHEDVKYIKLSGTWFNQGWETWYENANDTPITTGLNKHLGRAQ